MATTTTNLGLTKPAMSDNVDITVINANMDKIDAMISNMPITGNIVATSQANFESALTTLCSGLNAGKFRCIEVYCNWSGSFTSGARSLAIVYKHSTGGTYNCYILYRGAKGYYYSGEWHWQTIPNEVTFERKIRTYTDITVPNVGYIKVDSYSDMGVSTQKYLLSITPRGWGGHIENVTFAKSSLGTDIYMIAPAGTTVSNINVEYVFSNI